MSYIDAKSLVEHDGEGRSLESVLFLRYFFFFFFVMYYIYATSGPSLLIESSDSMIIPTYSLRVIIELVDSISRDGPDVT